MAAVCIIHIDVALNLFYGHSYFQNNKEKKKFQHINKTNFKNNNQIHIYQQFYHGQQSRPC